MINKANIQMQMKQIYACTNIKQIYKYNFNMPMEQHMIQTQKFYHSQKHNNSFTLKALMSFCR